MATRNDYDKSVAVFVRMKALFEALPEVPTTDKEEDNEDYIEPKEWEADPRDELCAEGLMEMYLETDEREWFRTTEAGREALIRYVRGDR